MRLVGRHLDRPVVLAIPRGGVPVGAEVARALQAPLDVLVVRKVGAPGEPEYGLGAIGEGGAMELDEPRVRALGLRVEDLAPIVAAERAEVEARVRRYRDGRPPLSIAGRSAIVVDDGIATGGTLAAALRLARAGRPARLVAAVGVAARGSLAALSAQADVVVVARLPDRLEAVGEWYARFEPVAETEVRRLLAAARARYRELPPS